MVAELKAEFEQMKTRLELTEHLLGEQSATVEQGSEREARATNDCGAEPRRTLDEDCNHRGAVERCR